MTLLAVLAVAAAFFPPTQWSRIWNETWASLFYVQNWQLAFSEVDYYVRDSSVTSPLQHFWSLSIQVQVFILWPVLILLVAAGRDCGSLRQARSWRCCCRSSVSESSSARFSAG